MALLQWLRSPKTRRNARLHLSRIKHHAVGNGIGLGKIAA